jgi:hypothetical protein
MFKTPISIFESMPKIEPILEDKVGEDEKTILNIETEVEYIIGEAQQIIAEELEPSIES